MWWVWDLEFILLKHSIIVTPLRVVSPAVPTSPAIAILHCTVAGNYRSCCCSCLTCLTISRTRLESQEVDINSDWNMFWRPSIKINFLGNESVLYEILLINVELITTTSRVNIKMWFCFMFLSKLFSVYDLSQMLFFSVLLIWRIQYWM